MLSLRRQFFKSLNNAESFNGGDECQFISSKDTSFIHNCAKQIPCQGKDRETKRNRSKMFVKEDDWKRIYTQKR